MLTIRSEVVVAGISGRQITNFLLDCSDQRYQRWWPGTHLQLHTTGLGHRHVGDAVFIDEYVGTRRIRMSGVVVQATPGKKIVWQFRKGVRLPVYLTLELTDCDGGVLVRHTITAGYRGIGRVLDALLRCYFSPAFAAEMDQHVHTEFALLRNRLRYLDPPAS
jgi:hypothetical protein